MRQKVTTRLMQSFFFQHGVIFTAERIFANLNVWSMVDDTLMFMVPEPLAVRFNVTLGEGSGNTEIRRRGL